MARLLAVLPGTVVGAALVVRLFDEWWSYLPAGVVEDLHRDLGISFTAAGWLLALLTLGALAGSPLTLYADHADRRRCAVAGALLISGCLAAYAIGAPFWVLAAATAVTGTASDLLVDAVEAALGEGGGEQLDRVLGRQHALASLGDVLGPGLLALGASTGIGWRGAFAITAVAMLGFAGYLRTIPFPPPPAACGTLREAVAEAWTVAGRRDVQHLAVVELLLAPLDEPLLAFVIARAATGGGSGAATQAIAVATMAGGVGGSLLVGRVGMTPRLRTMGALTLLVGTVLAVLAPAVAPRRGGHRGGRRRSGARVGRRPPAHLDGGAGARRDGVDRRLRRRRRGSGGARADGAARRSRRARGGVARLPGRRRGGARQRPPPRHPAPRFHRCVPFGRIGWRGCGGCERWCCSAPPPPSR